MCTVPGKKMKGVGLSCMRAAESLHTCLHSLERNFTAFSNELDRVKYNSIGTMGARGASAPLFRILGGRAPCYFDGYPLKIIIAFL